jgi:hypothetical protein
MKNLVSEALIKELNRYNTINKYIQEQDAPDDLGVETPAEPLPATPEDSALGGSTPPEGEPMIEPGQPVDITNDPDVEEIGDDELPTDSSIKDKNNTGDVGTEEIDITELITSQKNIETKQEEYMNSMMGKLEDLEQKLTQMDSIFQKINDLENTVEKYRPKSPEEKLQLRSLDSYPYSQKLSDFFTEKEPQFEKQGKEEYILRPEDVENVDKTQIRKSFDLGLGN